MIGAGPLGLATARALQAQGLPFTVFEAHDDVGGLWDIRNPSSTVYESAHLISSKRMTEFTEFPMRDAVAPYPKHDEVRRYFGEYADHFGLRRHIEFRTRVRRLAKTADGWTVTTERDGVESTRSVTAVCIATGTLHHRHQPALPGAFSGTLLHSADYKSPAVFARRRTRVRNSMCRRNPKWSAYSPK
ncbi:MAG: flavin-containing monooxygenase [Gemmatimonadota bacterium]